MSKPKTSERGRRVALPVTRPEVRRRSGRPHVRRASPLATAARPHRQLTPARTSHLGSVGWRSLATTGISVAGTGVAAYLTLAHYTTGITLACPDTGAINCEAVTTSKQSVVAGVPVAVLGLLFFVSMLVISLPWAWRTANRYVAPARLAMSTVGIGFVFYLLYAELFEIQKICLWCTSVHVLTFLMFVVVATGWDDATRHRHDVGGQPE